jgi:hypothetical protein
MSWALIEQDDSDDDVSGDDVKNDLNIDEILMKCPTNIKEPNFSRWGTVSSCAKIVLEHWLPIFYMAQNNLHHQKKTATCTPLQRILCN